MKRYVIGIIASFLSEDLVRNQQERQVAMPWGEATVILGEVEGKPVAAVQRYGPEIRIASSWVNYRANIWALKKMGVKYVIAMNALGSINPEITPGSITLPHDFLDFTKGRPLSFFEKESCWVRVDMTDAFCSQLRKKIMASAASLQIPLIDHAVFACSEGPRFESAAEVKMYQMLGADLVGTPVVPEIILAREAGMCYSSIAAIMNLGCGMVESVAHDDMTKYYRSCGAQEKVEKIVRETMRTFVDDRTCRCAGAALEGAAGRFPAWYLEETEP